MPDLLKRGLARLTAIMADRGAQEILYWRDSRSIVCRATFGQKLLKLENEIGAHYMAWTDMSFLIPAQDLVLDGQAFEPEQGDLIEIPFTHKTDRYQVNPYANEPAWRWTDPNQTQLRVHAKLVETLEPL